MSAASQGGGGSPERGDGGGAGPEAVWAELFSTVSSLQETVELSLQAFTPDPAFGEQKAVSATTKKRLLVKAVHGLQKGKDGLQVLTDHLKALQAASQQWQKTMMFASRSHEDLMEQLESTNRDLQLTTERMRTVEAQRIAANKEVEMQRMQLSQLEAERRALQAALKQRDDELGTSQFAGAELQAQLASAKAAAEAAQESEAAALAARDRAIGALDGAKAEAAKAAANAERHQEAVAKLTADNLVFLMNLKKAEADLAAAHQECRQLRLAAEKQRGPWFDEVRASVEERVRAALVRAENLEHELEAVRVQHLEEMEELRGQKNDLEGFVASLRARESKLEEDLSAAVAARQAADAASATATAELRGLQARHEALNAENRVLMENIKAMRQECTERWVTEQAALSQVEGLRSTIAQLESLVSETQARARQLEAALDAQTGVNRQLMAKKEAVEWELMAALAKVGNGAPAPLALAVSGTLQLDRGQQGAAGVQAGSITSVPGSTRSTTATAVQSPRVLLPAAGQPAGAQSSTGSLAAVLEPAGPLPSRTALDYFSSPPRARLSTASTALAPLPASPAAAAPKPGATTTSITAQPPRSPPGGSPSAAAAMLVNTGAFRPLGRSLGAMAPIIPASTAATAGMGDPGPGPSPAAPLPPAVRPPAVAVGPHVPAGSSATQAGSQAQPGSVQAPVSAAVSNPSGGPGLAGSGGQQGSVDATRMQHRTGSDTLMPLAVTGATSTLQQSVQPTVQATVEYASSSQGVSPRPSLQDWQQHPAHSVSGTQQRQDQQGTIQQAMPQESEPGSPPLSPVQGVTSSPPAPHNAVLQQQQAALQPTSVLLMPLPAINTRPPESSQVSTAAGATSTLPQQSDTSAATAAAQKEDVTTPTKQQQPDVGGRHSRAGSGSIAPSGPLSPDGSPSAIKQPVFPHPVYHPMMHPALMAASTSGMRDHPNMPAFAATSPGSPTLQPLGGRGGGRITANVMTTPPPQHRHSQH